MKGEGKTDSSLRSEGQPGAWFSATDDGLLTKDEKQNAT
jgi:hypothetical protein